MEQSKQTENIRLSIIEQEIVKLRHDMDYMNRTLLSKLTCFENLLLQTKAAKHRLDDEEFHTDDLIIDLGHDVFSCSRLNGVHPCTCHEK